MVGLGVDWLAVGGVTDDEIERLRAFGLQTAADVLQFRVADLADKLQMPLERALAVVKAARGHPRTAYSDNEAAGPISTSTLLLPSDLQGILASDLIRQRRSSPFKPIVSMCPDLDRILGGGFAIGLLTEICGLPGLGKTQLCMQLACTVQIPQTMQGNQGEAIYIDCEGSLVAQRQLQIAEALCAILQKSGNAISAETMLSRIHVYRVFNAVQQQSVIRVLPAFLAEHPNVRLLIIDSVAFHMRHGVPDLSQRTRLLASMAQQLTFLAQKFHLAVIMTNQMAIAADRASLVPALGPSWAHHSNHRIVLEPAEAGASTMAKLVKSPSHPPGQAEFAITKAGIRTPARSPLSAG